MFGFILAYFFRGGGFVCWSYVLILGMSCCEKGRVRGEEGVIGKM